MRKVEHNRIGGNLVSLEKRELAIELSSMEGKIFA